MHITIMVLGKKDKDKDKVCQVGEVLSPETEKVFFKDIFPCWALRGAHPGVKISRQNWSVSPTHCV